MRDFVTRIPELAYALLDKIDAEKDNSRFQKAFNSFFLTCQNALDPHIKQSAVKEMLVQHLLTERLFKKVFQNEDWFKDNVIAREMEDVIMALASGDWSREGFLKSLDPFFNVIEDHARTLPNYAAKQEFLNTVYERFFQGYSTETADTMGIVYTPQEIVDWMGASIERCLHDDMFANEIMLLPKVLKRLPPVCVGILEHEERPGESNAAKIRFVAWELRNVG